MKKYIRPKQLKFFTEEVSKAIISRQKLKNQFWKTKTQESKNQIKYNKQRNLCVITTRKATGLSYENLDLKDITNRKKF